MARRYNSASTGRKSNIAKLFLFFAALLVLGFMFFRYYWSGGGNYTNIPEEYQINYVPADFQGNVGMDDDDALAVLSNPQRYRREFNDMIHDFNLSLLYHVANRMGMTENVKNSIRQEYDKHHPYIRNMYYNDFMAMKDTTSNLYQAWYENELTNSVDLLNEVSSKYTCFMVNLVLSEILETQGGRIAAKGSNVDTPCGIAMTEGLRPMIKRLQNRAAIEDFSRAKGLMEERVERVIAELATMEVRDKKGLSKQLKTKVFGYSVSSTDLEISAISILKVGFDIQKYFSIDLNTNAKVVTVTLPEPRILSHEVYPKVDKLDIGWLREVQNADFNTNFNALRAEFRREALHENDVMNKAKNQAVEIMNTMVGPIVASLGNNYKLKVNFQETGDTYDDAAFPEENYRQVPDGSSASRPVEKGSVNR